MPNTSSPYTDKAIAAKLAHATSCEASNHAVEIMHVCGTHENAISRAGLRKLLPENVEVIAQRAGYPMRMCWLKGNQRDRMQYSQGLQKIYLKQV